MMAGGSLSVLRPSELHGSAFKSVASSRATDAVDIDWADFEEEFTAARGLPEGEEKNKKLTTLCNKVRPFGGALTGRLSLVRFTAHTANTIVANKKLAG